MRWPVDVGRIPDRPDCCVPSTGADPAENYRGRAMKRAWILAALFPGGTIVMWQDPLRAQAWTEGGADAIRPFKVHYSDEELADLKRRIAATRWPDKEIVSDPSPGVRRARVQKRGRYWAKDYEWRKCEARLSARPNFVTTIDGVDIQFIQVKSK